MYYEKLCELVMNLMQKNLRELINAISFQLILEFYGWSTMIHANLGLLSI
jgi:hypothetical protein